VPKPVQSFGDGKRIIQYLGTYVCRTAIFDARMLAVSDGTVTFSWKDRARGNARRTETLSGIEFTARYLRHVLPLGMRAIRRYGFCHPAAKTHRERIAFHTGIPLVVGGNEQKPHKPAPLCPSCKQEMVCVVRLLTLWKIGRDPPKGTPCPA
jgi:hypothetical protein